MLNRAPRKIVMDFLFPAFLALVSMTALPTALADNSIFSLLPMQKSEVTHVAFSHTGRYLAYSFSDQLHLWDVFLGEKVPFFIQHNALIRSFAITPDENHALVVDDNGGIFIWNLTSHQRIQSHQFASGNLTVAIAKNNHLFAVGNRRGEIFIGETKEWKIVTKFSAHNFGVKSLGFSDDCRFLFSAGWDQLVKVFDLTRLPQIDNGFFFKSGVRGLKAHLGMVNSLSISPDGSQLLTGSFCDGAGNLSDPPRQDSVLRLWDISTKKPVKDLGLPYGVTQVCYLPILNSQKAYLIASAGGNFWGTLHELDTYNWQTRVLFKDTKDLQNNISSLAIHPSLPLIALGASDGQIHLMDRQTDKLLLTLVSNQNAWAIKTPTGDFETASSKPDHLLLRTIQNLPDRKDAIT